MHGHSLPACAASRSKHRPTGRKSQRPQAAEAMQALALMVRHVPQVSALQLSGSCPLPTMKAVAPMHSGPIQQQPAHRRGG